MGYSYTYDKKDEIVYSIIEGAFKTSETIDHLRELVEDDEIHDMIRIVDLSLATDLELVLSETKIIGELFTELEKKGVRNLFYGAYTELSRDILKVLNPIFSDLPTTVAVTVFNTKEELNEVLEIVRENKEH